MTARKPVVLFGGKPTERLAYGTHLPRAAAAAGLEMRLVMDPLEVDPAEVDYLILSPSGPVRDFGGYARLKAILNLWAGVEQALALPLPERVPLTRMVEDGLSLGMLDYVTGHVLRHHLGLDRVIHNTTPLAWGGAAPPLARDRRVSVLGLGTLGAACAARLVQCGFRVSGWSRRPRAIDRVICHAGSEGLHSALDGAEILVLLLPETPETTGLIGAEALARLAPGAAVINAGRGPLIDDATLLAALDGGKLGHATLDVFDIEPLPDEHPFWTHPKVTVTPHIASITRPETAAPALVAQILRSENGEPLRYVVDRGSGY
ncbi:MAG: glyoxylate/hydroxypyruvate reductase A [Pseudomonadota bacterium]